MYQICVSGAAKGESVEEGRILASHLGKAIANAGHSLLTGATNGLPDYAARAYKKAGGKMSVGISPASSRQEHILKYRLPIDAYDTILFTGLHYVGRDALLINSADAVVSLGGRLGTLHEFTIAMETRTPIGFLQGAGGISNQIQTILEAAGETRANETLFFNEDADELIHDVTKLLDKMYIKYRDIYDK